MNTSDPEPADQLVAIQRLLRCSELDAAEVLERAATDPLWPYRDNLACFGEIARFHWQKIRAERESIGGGS